ncbi:MAG: bifunctional phosphoribosylaminoimidazolecarboxamide formyltransferase/IMP cyclohydrolase [Candidatus Omnitrophota bacterium]
MKIERALISVSDKTGLEEFTGTLNRFGVEIISTGGTAEAIKSFGIPVVEVSSYTGFPEMLEGRVKTLHPKIHAGILALREDKEHMRQLQDKGIQLIDMVVVNLYPFEEVTARPEVALDEAIENIDIGGPSMLRSGAKNYRSVAVVSSASQYGRIIDELENNNGELKETTLQELAIEVFDKTSQYDGAINKFLSERSSMEAEKSFPGKFNLRMEKVRDLRYGENPHQHAAFYRDIDAAEGCGIADADQLQGKELSFNNILDLSSVIEIVKNFSNPAVSIVKHNNPCGVAVADTLEKAYLGALDCDRMSAFGGIMGFNGRISKEMAELILGEANFIECIIAPGYEDDALAVFSSKKNLRILSLPLRKFDMSNEKDIKKIPGGVLLQDMDTKSLNPEDIKVVTKKQPSKELLDSLIFGWDIVKYVKSNAIVLCHGTKTVGIGAGQMSRVDSVMIAVSKAGQRAKGAILASDAFFPKGDSIEKAHEAGISAIIQPGGSIKDKEVIEACDHFDIPMIFTGIRHFRH